MNLSDVEIREIDVEWLIRDNTQIFMYPELIRGIDA
jgi:hypothetical protein